MQTFDIDRVDWEKLSTSAINSPVSEFDDDDFDGDDDDSDDEDM